MPAERMNVDERYKYLRIKQERYRKANRAERSRLLDEMQGVTGLHRKSLIRLINSPLQRHKRSRQRGVVYGPQMEYVIAKVWKVLDYPCAERPTPQLLATAEHLERHGQLLLTHRAEIQAEAHQSLNRGVAAACLACP